MAAVARVGNRKLSLAFYTWISFLHESAHALQRERDCQTAFRIFKRIGNAKVAAAWNSWKVMHTSMKHQEDAMAAETAKMRRTMLRMINVRQAAALERWKFVTAIERMRFGARGELEDARNQVEEQKRALESQTKMVAMQRVITRFRCLKNKYIQEGFVLWRAKLESVKLAGATMKHVLNAIVNNAVFQAVNQWRSIVPWLVQTEAEAAAARAAHDHQERNAGLTMRRVLNNILKNAIFQGFQQWKGWFYSR
jgi:hypothetical protein